MPALQAHNNKVFFESRKPFIEIFDKPHILLGHQVENELNNLYKEAIYMGIPLVTNSPPYSSVTYNFEGFKFSFNQPTKIHRLSHLDYLDYLPLQIAFSEDEKPLIFFQVFLFGKQFLNLNGGIFYQLTMLSI